jgi:hypothetical protein
MQLNLIKDFEEVADYYQVQRESDRCWIESTGRTKNRVLKTSDASGYRIYGLILKSGKRKTILEHRLFAICFIDNPEDKEQVNHIDGVKTNNLLSNLEWMTPKENIRHAIKTGLMDNSGEKHYRAKLLDSDIPLIFELRKSGMTQKAIGNHFGVSRINICDILSGKSRSQNIPK